MGNKTCLAPADSPTVYPATMRYAAARVRNIDPRSPPSVWSVCMRHPRQVPLDLHPNFDLKEENNALW